MTNNKKKRSLKEIFFEDELQEARGGTRGTHLGRASRFHGGKYDYAVLPSAILNALMSDIIKDSSFLQDWGYSEDFKYKSSYSAGDHAVITLDTPRGELDFTVIVRPRKRR